MASDPPIPSEDATALAGGAAFVVLEGLARTRVAGTDVAPWLQDLLTADLDGQVPGEARRSLLLTPTGRIRADVVVVRRDGGAELLQEATDASAIGELLAPYVLSAEVELGEPEPVLLVGLPGPTGADAFAGGDRDRVVASPSVLGGGADLVTEPGHVEEVRRSLAGAGLREVDAAAAETLRVRRGIPRWRRDVGPDDFPVGALLDRAVAETKGCFLGQEAVAKIRNLGHPPTVLRHLRTTGAARSGDVVLAGDDPAGAVTSAAPDGEGGTVLLARLAWDARAPFSLPEGGAVEPVDPAR